MANVALVHVCVHVYTCVLYACVVCLILCACLVYILLIKTTRLPFFTNHNSLGFQHTEKLCIKDEGDRPTWDGWGVQLQLALR